MSKAGQNTSIPQWGKFKFGHTHPEYSNSGTDRRLGRGLRRGGQIERTVAERRRAARSRRSFSTASRSRWSTTAVRPASSAGEMFEGGPQYLSAAVLYENMVIESYDTRPQPPLPIVAIYPKEGTFWSDHPVGIVQRDWVDDEHRKAAEKYIGFLTAPEQQKRAMEFGFRPADVAIPLAAPIDAAHGVDPKQPETTLEVPSARVTSAVIELWKNRRRSMPTSCWPSTCRAACRARRSTTPNSAPSNSSTCWTKRIRFP